MKTQTVIKLPIHSYGLPISTKSDLNGVCIYLKFDRAKKRSVFPATIMTGNSSLSPSYRKIKGNAVVLDKKGDRSKITYSLQIGEITCIND